MNTLHPELSIDTSIAWFYLITNSLRVFTYMPQIVAVARSKDGARAISLWTWGSWMVAHAAAVMYGLQLQDLFFTVISSINLLGTSAVTCISCKRRIRFNLDRRFSEAAAAALLAGGVAAARFAPSSIDENSDLAQQPGDRARTPVAVSFDQGMFEERVRAVASMQQVAGAQTAQKNAAHHTNRAGLTGKSNWLRHRITGG